MTALGSEAARMAVTMLHAPDCPAGFVPVVIDGGFGGVILHEACVHSLEATSVAKGNSEFCGKLGQKIASDVVTAVDDGTMPVSYTHLDVYKRQFRTERMKHRFVLPLRLLPCGGDTRCGGDQLLQRHQAFVGLCARRKEARRAIGQRKNAVLYADGELPAANRAFAAQAKRFLGFEANAAIPVAIQMVFSFFREKFNGARKSFPRLDGMAKRCVGTVSYTHLAYLLEFRGMRVSAEQIIVGAGSEYLYNLIVQLLGRKHVYAVENPGHVKIPRIYEKNGIDVRYVNVDDRGMPVAELRASGADVVHLSPSHHFPTGVVMPIGRRQELLAWAGEAEGRYIIEDDYDLSLIHILRSCARGVAQKRQLRTQRNFWR